MSTAAAIFSQIWFCPPVWLIACVLFSLGKALIGKTSERRTLWRRWAIVFAVVFLTSLLWAPPLQMLRYSGPYSGKVVDEVSGEPVPYALVWFRWPSFLGAHRQVWALTDADGVYEIGWQGFGNWRIGAGGSGGTQRLEALGYRRRIGDDHEWLESSGWPGHDHDKQAPGASGVDRIFRLHRVFESPSYGDYAVQFYHLRRIVDKSEREKVARVLYHEIYARLCSRSSQYSGWMPSNGSTVATSVSIVRHLDRDKADAVLELVQVRDGDYHYIPARLDTDTVKLVCARLRLTDEKSG